MTQAQSIYALRNYDGNLNGYVKGMEIVWLEIGNEKAGHIFQVSSRAGS
jgi:NADP-dependent 3-hydroxy acid dehydrogenase YdfG